MFSPAKASAYAVVTVALSAPPAESQYQFGDTYGSMTVVPNGTAFGPDG
jgi:hypothetical protein